MSEFEVRQEDDTIAAAPIFAAGGAAIVIGAIAVAVASLVLSASVPPRGAQPAAPAETRLSNVEQTPIWDAEDGLALRRRQERALAGWGWIDRDAGIATIPIDRAIDLVVSREAP